MAQEAVFFDHVVDLVINGNNVQYKVQCPYDRTPTAECRIDLPNNKNECKLRIAIAEQTNMVTHVPALIKGMLCGWHVQFGPEGKEEICFILPSVSTTVTESVESDGTVI